MSENVTSNNQSRYEGLKVKLHNLNEGKEAVGGIIREYDSLIEQVFLKIKSVQGIANKTNLLAINASIETIHASDLLASFEEIVTKNLILQAKIIAQILEYDPDFMCQDGAKFAKECGMEEFFVTDDQGIIQFTNMPAWKNTSLNSMEILRILQNRDLEIALPATGSGLDSEQYKVVGVSRTDQAGIIQIGAHFMRPKGQLAINGFGVVAQEAKRLADVSKEISSRITALTNDLGDRLKELDKAYKSAEDSIAKSIKAVDDPEEDSAVEIREEISLAMKDRLAEFEAKLLESQKTF